MKNIFIATDFSPASKNAAEYGIELAKQYNANVHLFHAYQSGKDIAFITNPAQPSHQLRQRLIAEAEMINKDGKVTLEMSAEEGQPIEMILENAKKNRADLIICAMKDKARGFKKIFGSTTLSLINHSNIPMIIVPEAATFKKPKHISLAIDMDPQTSPITLQLVKDICDHFFSKLSVFYALNENYKEEEIIKFHPPVSISEIIHLRPQYEFCVGNDIAKTMHDFAGHNAVDMLALIPHKHSQMERWLTESITKNVVYKTYLPVLILPQKVTGVDDLKLNIKMEKMWKEVEQER
ncbi:MAG: universal stress protein [Ferruginibacter sp.]